MYKDFFQLDNFPFELTPDPKFLYLTDQHKNALAHLMYGIHQRKGFIVITGEVGCGKTLICRKILNDLDDNVISAYIFNSTLSKENLIKAILTDLGENVSNECDYQALLDKLYLFLIEKLKQNKNVALLIDEAQGFADDVLESIRVLSNLETETKKLLQIILVGQPELQNKLNKHSLRQLNQRVAVRFHLNPLNQEQTVGYIYHRLRTAGNPTIKINKDALSLIYNFTKGIPRLINILCDKALLIAYSRQEHAITEICVKKAIFEISPVKAGLIKKMAIIINTWSNLKKLAFSTGLAAALVIFISTPFINHKKIKQNNVSNINIIQADNNLKSIDIKEKIINKENYFALCYENILKNKYNISVKLSENKNIYTNITNFIFANRYLARFGLFVYHSGNTNPEFLLKYNYPIIVKIKNSGSMLDYAVIKAKDDIISLYTPDKGYKEISIEKFLNIYDNEAIFIVEDILKSSLEWGIHMKGEPVAIIQKLLSKASFYSGPINSIFDYNTMQSVIEFQKSYGLLQDGIVGPETISALYNFYQK